MSAHLWVSRPSATPTPADIAAYLLNRGFRFEALKTNWAVYSAEIDGQTIELEVPQLSEAPDYPRAVGLLIEDLARLEQRAQSALVRDIQSSSVDLVRFGLEGSSTRDGRIPVEAGRRVFGAARDALLSAACSVVKPRSVFGNRKYKEAFDLLNQARFGQTEVGSFVLTMECNIAPKLQKTLLNMPDVDVDAPFERKSFVTLARGLNAAVVAIRESAASGGSIEPFRNRAAEGLSANLCDAVAEMLDATSADSMRAEFSFAARRPVDNEIPRSTVFVSNATGILREAARMLREEADYPECDIIGTVKKLVSDNVPAGGDVLLKARMDDQVRTVRAKLAPNDYQIAIDAHKGHSWIRCTGELSRQGRFWVLENPRDMSVIGDLDEWEAEDANDGRGDS